MLTSDDKRSILFKARDAVAEIESLEESIRVIEARLFSGPSASPIRIRDGGFDEDRVVDLVESRSGAITALRLEHRQASDAIAQASQIIGDIRNASKRAALRYYFICRKSYAYIADVLGCDISTVKRWIAGDL